MKIFWILALLSTLGACYYYNRVNERRWTLLHQQCLEVEQEIKQCDLAARAIRKETRRVAMLLAENKRLKARLKPKKSTSQSK